MKIANKCDNCGKETKRVEDLCLIATFPEIKHYCRDCCEKENIAIHPLHKIAFHLV